MSPLAPQQISIVPAQSEGELLQAFAIREVVFIEEQHVPQSLDHDADDARAFHLLAFDGGHAIGTGRLVLLAETPRDESGLWAQVSRMAVLQASRSSGVGSKLLAALEEEAVRRNATGITLHAPLTSLDFYKKRGYQAVGGVFQAAGMPHLELHKKFEQ
jgi:predicted GNAT family N-acyltransferase